MDAPTKAVPNDAKIVQLLTQWLEVPQRLAPSNRTIVMRKFLEFFSESFFDRCNAAQKPASNGAVKEQRQRRITIANMMASVSCRRAEHNSFFLPIFLFANPKP